MTSTVAQSIPLRITVTAMALLLAGCVQGAASTTACPAFVEWQDDGFPTDLSSADAGPRFLRLLAEVQDTAPAVAADARTVLESSQHVHEAWMRAGGAQGPPGEVERATEVARRETTPEVMGALQKVLAYGRETCGVAVPTVP